MPILLLRQFLQLESSSAIVLFFMALMGMIWANSPLAFVYQQFAGVSLFWINEGLMTVFFLVVGLELKRNFVEGGLSRPSQVMLPLVAGIGGMIVPALIYLFINHANPIALKGWATPVATDIAFALGVLSIFGKRVPVTLKLFLLMLAIFDDLGAIFIIALFYSKGLSCLWLGAAAIIVFILYLLNLSSVKRLSLYLFLGALLWVCFLLSGIHPTIAGVLLACLIPAERKNKNSPMHRLEQALHPWVAYVIVPLFALVNAGISFHEWSLNTLTNTIVWGIILGLFLGKQMGVFLFSWAAIQLGLTTLPEKSSWLQLYGIALLCGIGFTMSLFLGTLSFENSYHHIAEVRLGVIVGSLLSGLSGVTILLAAFFKNGASSQRSSAI